MVEKENNVQSEQMNQRFVEKINEIRRKAGYLSIEEVLMLHDRENVVLDPFSLLISKDVEIGEKNVFYPNVVIQREDQGNIRVADENTFFLNTYLFANQGTIDIGRKNHFGDGGCTIKANNPDAHIVVGDNGRYINGAVIIGNSDLGSGSQIIGSITVQDTVLAGGQNFQHANPDERGAVLKGIGLARGLYVAQGKVINAFGSFQDAPIESQSKYHPKQTK
jgi:carbonic anhydrase/acetyltransferase-like protein (isoleucine patch superfamily)